MNFKELTKKINATIVEIKEITQDIELALMVVDMQHHDRLRTRSSDKD